jgi:hypothetical protein
MNSLNTLKIDLNLTYIPKSNSSFIEIEFFVHYTGHFIIFCMITNIYNKKTKGPTLMELFTATGKLKKFF